MAFHLAMTRNEVLMCATAQMNLESIMLSEGQPQKATYSVVSLKARISKCTGRECTRIVARGWREVSG